MSLAGASAPPDPLRDLLAAVDRVVDAVDVTKDYLLPAKGTRLRGELEILESVRERWRESGRIAWSAPAGGVPS